MRLCIILGFMVALPMVHSNLLVAKSTNIESIAVASDPMISVSAKQEKFLKQRFGKFNLASNKGVQRNWEKSKSISRIQQWDVFETSFTSSVKYENPLNEMDTFEV